MSLRNNHVGRPPSTAQCRRCTRVLPPKKIPPEPARTRHGRARRRSRSRSARRGCLRTARAALPPARTRSRRSAVVAVRTARSPAAACADRSPRRSPRSRTRRLLLRLRAPGQGWARAVGSHPHRLVASAGDDGAAVDLGRGQCFRGVRVAGVVTSVTNASIVRRPCARATETRWCPSRTKCRRPIR